ncbi:hypothetical protein RDABS01_023990 [Bienertia sinuspersici]
MATATTTTTTTTTSSLFFHLSPPIIPKNIFLSPTFNKSSYQPLISYHTLSKFKTLNFQNPNHRQILISKKPRNYKVSAAASEDAAIIPAETAQDIVSSTSGNDGVSNVISILLFIAFVALSILTIGVIYISVTDFLQKREREKFEKEEAAKKKKGGKKVRTRARAGPRGFGQKVDEEDDD